jgi:hypothetical protein
MRRATRCLEDAKIPHQEYYKRASASAHPSALTTLPYMFDSNGNIRAMLYPEFNADLFISLSNEITVEALFVAYCFKNALADPDMMPPDWYRALAQHAREFSGLPLEHLEDDWEERERRFRSLHSQVRPAEEIDNFLRAHPNSAYNLKQRAGEGVNNSDSEGVTPDDEEGGREYQNKRYEGSSELTGTLGSGWRPA